VPGERRRRAGADEVRRLPWGVLRACDLRRVGFGVSAVSGEEGVVVGATGDQWLSGMET
jgi:hypothetical protein